MPDAIDDGVETWPLNSDYSGWWFQPPEKYESQLGLWFPIYGENKNVPNHQPDILLTIMEIHIQVAGEEK